MTHICVSELTIIGSDNGLSPGRRQAIIWNNAGLLLIEPLGTNLSEISIGIQTFSFKKMHLNMSSAIWRPFCLGLNVLSHQCVPMNFIANACYVLFWAKSLLDPMLTHCGLETQEQIFTKLDWNTNKNFRKFNWKVYKMLTLKVRGPSYLGLTRSISWLLVPWLLASPGHQQPWYWLCKISKSWSYMRNDFNYLWHVSVGEWHKM